MHSWEAAEAYILSQRHAGWTLVPNEYSDGGYSGANIERPGVRQLLADIEAGKVDCVVVYKVCPSLGPRATTAHLSTDCGRSLLDPVVATRSHPSPSSHPNP